MQRTRTTETSAFGVTPQAAPAATGPVATPKSVAANRVSDERVASFAHDALVEADQRPAKQRTVTVQRRATPKLVKPTASSVNAVARKRAIAPMMSFVGVFLFVGGSLFNPLQADVAQAAVDTPVLVKTPPAPQQYTAHGTYAVAAADRDGYDVTVPAPKVVKPVVEEDEADADAETTDDSADAAATETQPVSAANTLAATAATPDPGSAQAIALQQVTARGWGTDQYNCLVSLWNKESGWRVNAYNPSGAYGIPQALPGSKMSSAGADWQTNPATQITWGLNYIAGVYGTPCGAWGHSQANNWY
ncbi:lytic transglycosylase domain-containing protein [Curtobacterium flaccumfaciens pv. flaccumfaciens]|uniref:lytic transglycosylase domain-containing protein n=1 Tax=Curtobacterium flaccumfaciens TaxID=2035 RepID=UPI00217ED453|nr:lytic transglycosylase domain-containing protein [Curtobacterium flaccumfaciens]MCS6551911.1 lytic transglycosylase domain-containing protein [Curtobacterium flaccumfaciens pv. flaccumfaciens]